MIEFIKLSWTAHIFIVFILGICIFAQTLTLVLRFFHYGKNTIGIFTSLLELFIVFEILTFSLIYGQMLNGYSNGFAVASGYEDIRIRVFILILIFTILVFILKKNLLVLSVIPATIISLPIMEAVLARAFPWFFIGSLIFFFIRSLKLCIVSASEIRTNISSLSVIHAMNTLHTGVLFSENDGHILLSNYQIQNLMIAITGKVFRNALDFYNAILSGDYESRYNKAKIDGQIVYLLPDGSVWMFTKTDISFLMKNYIHISVADVTKLWILTTKLQLQDEELRLKSEELKNTIANLHILSQRKEIDHAKMRAHDILGQRLSVLLRIIQNENKLDYDLLTSLAKGLLAELKAEQSEISPQNEVENIRQVFAAIGVDIIFKGKLPEDNKKSRLFVDIIRESSTNAVRHGFATEIYIQSEEIDNKYNLIINNNGHTIDAPITPGSGIRVMKKKVSAQGGYMEIMGQPLFTLSVSLPGGE